VRNKKGIQNFVQNSEGNRLVWRHRHNGEVITVNLQEISDAVSDWFQFVS